MVSSRLKKSIEIIGIILFVLFLGVFIITVLNYSTLKQQVANELVSYGYVALFILCFLFELFPQLLNPIFPMILSFTVGLNFYGCLIIVIISSILGSYLGFSLGKKYGLKLVYMFFEDKQVDKTINFFKKYGKHFMWIAALTPLPYFPVVFGALDISKRDFILWGIIPRTILYLGTATIYLLGFTNFFV